MIQSFSFGVATEPGFLLWSLNDLASVKHVEDFWIPDIFDFEGFEALAPGLMLHIRFCFNDYCTQNWLSNWRLYNEYAYIRLFIYIYAYISILFITWTPFKVTFLPPVLKSLNPKRRQKWTTRCVFLYFCPVKMMMTILDPAETSSDLTQTMSTRILIHLWATKWESINPGCEGNTVLVLENLWIRRIYHVYWYVLCL